MTYDFAVGVTDIACYDLHFKAKKIKFQTPNLMPVQSPSALAVNSSLTASMSAGCDRHIQAKGACCVCICCNFDDADEVQTFVTLT